MEIKMHSNWTNAWCVITSYSIHYTKLYETRVDSELEAVAGLTRAEAFDRIINEVKVEQAEDLAVRFQKLSWQSDDAYEEMARDLLLAAVHRVGNSMPSNIMTANVEIPSDDVKGKIIGKEGRNVRAFERATSYNFV